ncbi:MAG: erythromycin esterase family protein [Acidobacteriota bacterium]|nr:erythromycin esterase family protein [Acidobacteriota bacterium]
MKTIIGKRVLLTIINYLLLFSVTCLGFTLSAYDLTFKLNKTEKSTFRQTDAAALALIRQSAHKLSGSAKDYDPLMKMIGDARFVLLGEATHGTHEFYRERARITRRLIEEKGFDAVVLEADWTDAYRVNEYVQAKSKDQTAEKSLSSFTRFPRWMWRNTDFRDLVGSIRSFNDSQQPEAKKVGVYGMDLYGLAESIREVTEYLRRIDPEAAKRAVKRYGCLTSYRTNPQQYGYDVSARMTKSCETEVAEQFQEMEQRFAAWQNNSQRERDDNLFSAYQSSRVVKNGEAYFRLSYQRNFSTWNLRDNHMADTIHALAAYLDFVGNSKSKIVIWAHNTHQGDARMTTMGETGELNVGYLMRKAAGENSVLIGFTTYTGRVLAASEWGAEGFTMRVRPALTGSYSRLFHDSGIPNFLLIFRGNERLTEELGSTRLERAIGVIYRPQTERQSHYFGARMSKQFDAVIHFDTTTAVKPL